MDKDVKKILKRNKELINEIKKNRKEQIEAISNVNNLLKDNLDMIAELEKGKQSLENLEKHSKYVNEYLEELFSKK